MSYQDMKDIKLNHISINNNSKCVIDSSVNKNTPGMLLIHAHWCGHCTRFLPTYKKIAKMLNTPDQVNVPLLGIESEELKKDKNQEITSKLNFHGFPTIKFFDQNGVIMDEDYNGKREADDILRELCNRYHKCYQ